ncbi:hypothetical protein BXZ70DRAFT_955355 [Cristinia sonorae]|uniref:Uncharacterized protein n=1 Tax=Cristinia sonorae TaxID=1940300 RepID=A0A8K0XLA8_9AGAR|nr:hypothetical protein BXZ70DRAFT_955355 [Cristinia sonorae]
MDCSTTEGQKTYGTPSGYFFSSAATILSLFMLPFTPLAVASLWSWGRFSLSSVALSMLMGTVARKRW